MNAINMKSPSYAGKSSLAPLKIKQKARSDLKNKIKAANKEQDPNKKIGWKVSKTINRNEKHLYTSSNTPMKDAGLTSLKSPRKFSRKKANNSTTATLSKTKTTKNLHDKSNLVNPA